MPTKLFALLVAIVLAQLPIAKGSEPTLSHIRPNKNTGTSAAVVVDAEMALIHTAQLFPTDNAGKILPPEQPEEQVNALFDRLESVLQQADSGLDRVVKLNVVLARSNVLPQVLEGLAKRMPEKGGPALSLVEGELARPGALLAIDAVALAGSNPSAGTVEHNTLPGFEGGLPGATLAVLPAGPRVYVSGQAERGEDLASATRETLESLEATLKHLGLGKEHVVQVKAFFGPLKETEVVEAEVARFFEGNNSPPLVLVDWRMALPIEIELIATSPKVEGEETVEYLSTPTLKPSPIYSRVARVNEGDLVYVSGLFGSEGSSGAKQVEAIFEELKGLLDEAKSDLRHLVKATYYVSEDDSSEALNALRPNYYDPARPPAASKAMVPGVGLEGRNITVDMIAVVPTTRPAETP